MTRTRRVSDDLPEAFVRLRDLVRIHLKQILKIPKKQPIHAAVLLVTIACEALSRLLDRRDHEVFADEYLSRRGVPYDVGRSLFKAVRNGLAHVYTPYPIDVRGMNVWPILSWTGPERGHLTVVRTLLVNGHQRIVPAEEGGGPVRLSLIVKFMVEDLNALFAEMEAQLRSNHSLRKTVERTTKAFRQKEAPRPDGQAAEVWRQFLRDRRF